MKDGRAVAAAGKASIQPASGPLDEATARWYVRHTGGQFRAFQRDGLWYLNVPQQTGSGPGTTMGWPVVTGGLP